VLKPISSPMTHLLPSADECRIDPLTLYYTIIIAKVQ
jgi:hypothetical protein